MLEWITETTTVWQRLKSAGKPVVIYGMGDGAIKIMNILQKYQIPVAAFFASDEFVRGHSFMGYQVHKLSEIEEMYEDFIIVMAFAIFDDAMTARIYEMEQKHELVAPDVPVVGDSLFDFDFLLTHEEKFRQVYEMLADEQSQTVYRNILNFKLSGKLAYLRSATTSKEEAYQNILKLDAEEDFVDLGAYKGDTIEEFLTVTGGKYKSITAFEPDRKNYQKLCARVQAMGLEDTACFHLAAHSQQAELSFANRAGRHSALTQTGEAVTLADSVDNVRRGKRVSFINMDVEGAEYAAILGCKHTIASHKPKMLISAYHRSEDMFALPLLVHELRPDYTFYLRHYQYIPAWDTNLYCV